MPQAKSRRGRSKRTIWDRGGFLHSEIYVLVTLKEVGRLAISIRRLETLKPHLAKVAVGMAETVATHREASAKLGEAHAGAELRNNRFSL